MLGGAQWFQLPLWGHKSATQSDTYRRSILSLGFGHLTPGYVHTHLHVFRAISSVYKCLFLLRLESNTLPGSIRSAKHQLKFCTDYQRSEKKKKHKKATSIVVLHSIVFVFVEGNGKASASETVATLQSSRSLSCCAGRR